MTTMTKRQLPFYKGARGALVAPALLERIIVFVLILD